MDTGSIDDILNKASEPAFEAEVAPEPTEIEAQPETIGQPRDETGRFAAKDETGVDGQETAEPVPPTEQADRLPRDVYEPLKAVRAENQELKRAIEAMQAQMAQQVPKPQPEPEVDFWENPAAVMQSQFQQFGQQLREQIRHEQITERIDQSEQSARTKYQDYDEKFLAFRQAVQLNPVLAREMAQSPDPAEFAYSRGRTALEIQRAGSIDELIAAERAKWEQEAVQAIQPRAQAPFTTATARSVGERGVPAFTGPRPLSAILKE